MSKKNLISLQVSSVSDCQSCHQYDTCFENLLNNLSADDLKRFNQQKVAFPKNEKLVKQGDTQKTFYIVNQGAFKATQILSSGREKIARFYLPGDFIGLESLSNPIFLYTIEACTPGVICKLLLSEFQYFINQYPHFRSYILNLMSHQLRIQLEYDPFASAESRLARFILEYYLRYKDNSFKPVELYLTRKDIAAYLGMAIETISRILSRWNQQGVLHLKEQYLNSVDTQKLSVLAYDKINVT